MEGNIEAADGIESAAENTILTAVLGDHPKTLILVTLIGEAGHGINATEIARLAGIERSTFYNHIEDLVAFDVVRKTRKVGNSQLYEINTDSPAAESLATLEWKLIEFMAEAEQNGGLQEIREIIHE